MTKSFIKRNLTAKNLLLVAFLLIVAAPAFGQGGASAISNAAGTVKDYWDPVKLILKAVGGIVGLIGGLRVYNRWTKSLVTEVQWFS